MDLHPLSRLLFAMQTFDSHNCYSRDLSVHEPQLHGSANIFMPKAALLLAVRNVECTHLPTAAIRTSELERQLASVKQTLDDSQSNGRLAAISSLRQMSKPTDFNQ